MSETDFYAGAMAVVGVVLLVWKSKRRFGRLNDLSIEQYSTFLQKIRAHLFDGLLYFVGFVLLGSAAITFFVEHGESFPTLSFLVAAFIVFLIVGSRESAKK